jgi:hypothetical protein
MKDLARLAALVVAAFLLVRNEAVAGGVPAMHSATAIVAFVVLAAVSLWRDGFVTASGVALVAHYGLALGFGHVDADLGAPLVGALVVTYLDLVDLAASLPRDRRVDRAFLVARLRHLALVLTIGTLAGVAAFAVAAVPWPSSEVLRVLGVLGAAAAVAVPLALVGARRRLDP